MPYLCPSNTRHNSEYGDGIALDQRVGLAIGSFTDERITKTAKKSGISSFGLTWVTCKTRGRTQAQAQILKLSF